MVLNKHFQIKMDSDPDVCRIASKTLWIHYLVSVSHFAEFHQNQPVTVGEMLINLLFQNGEGSEKVIPNPYLEPRKVNQFLGLVEPIQVSLKLAD